MSGSTPVALITGSSRGIGRAIAEQLASDKHAVVINYVSRRDAAQEVVQSIEGAGGTAIAVQGNVGVAHDRQRLVQSAIDRWGRLDVLVNNAGITSPGRVDLLDASPEDWDRVLDTNLKGPFFLSQLAANAMIQQRESGILNSAHIVNISSVSAYAVSTNRADYCVAKAGMQMMTWLFADRLAEFSIGVFEICPGVIESDMTAPVKEKYDRLIDDGLTPIRRWGKPQDIALAVSAIVRGSFPFSTGERINVDGGFHMRKL